MNYIFINNFTNQVHVFEDLKLQKCLTYIDNTFLNEYQDSKIFVISKDLSLILGYEDQCITDWKEQFAHSITVIENLTFWFMSKSMCFESCNGAEELSAILDENQDRHIFIGGGIDGGYKCYSYMDFYQKIIEIYSPKQNEDMTSIANGISDLKEILVSLKEHVETLGKEESANKEIIELKEELSKYKNDFYFKSVQRQGLDAMIEVLDGMCTLRYNSRNKSQDIVDSIDYGIKLVERALQKTFKIRFVSSKEGDLYNEETMIAYPSDSVPTDDTALSGCVAKSLSPAVYWSLPRVNSSDLEFLYKEESVILFV